MLGTATAQVEIAYMYEDKAAMLSVVNAVYAAPPAVSKLCFLFHLLILYTTHVCNTGYFRINSIAYMSYKNVLGDIFPFNWLPFIANDFLLAGASQAVERALLNQTLSIVRCALYAGVGVCA